MTEERFKSLAMDEMTDAQRKMAQAVLSGPRGSLRGPFKALLRSPVLGDLFQKVGAYIRFESSIPARLNELAILLTARKWTAQFEWYAHHELAMKAGLDPAIAAAIAEGKRPAKMAEDEALVYDFCKTLLDTGEVDDPLYARAVAMFGEPGVIDLVGALGYYCLVSLVLNVDRYKLPDGVAPPLKKLA